MLSASPSSPLFAPDTKKLPLPVLPAMLAATTVLLITSCCYQG